MIEANHVHGGHRQRLREQFLAGEDCSYTDEAALELLLTYAIPQQDVRPIARRLIERFTNLAGVLEADSSALCEISGIKSNSATLLRLVGWIRNGNANGSQALNDGRDLGSIYRTRPLDTPPPTQTPAWTEPEARTEVAAHARRIIARRGTPLFAKAVLSEAVDLLPRLPESESLDVITNFLRANLPFNAEETRRRNAQYIVRRMFPNGYADSALRSFARQYTGRQELREVCFYRFCREEPLMIDVVNDLLIPAIGSGLLDRRRIHEYLRDRFPSAKSHDDYTLAIIDALTAGGLVKIDHRELIFSYREVLLPSFAFVLHSEFPDPGMFDIGRLEQSLALRAMLWNPDRILSALYELRNHGIIAKVSEIDSFRQFTTRWTLTEVVDRLGSVLS